MFKHYVARLDRTSSPGWPLCKEASTIGDWLYPGKTFDPDPARLSMLWNLVQTVFDGTYEHFFKVFIKPEAHKAEKAADRRWRLILASSLPVQIAWHMAVGHLERSFLKEQPFIPPSYAESFFAGSWKRFKESCLQKQINWATDKSAWDWNSPGWVYSACKELRIRLTAGGTEEWLRVLDWLYDDAYVSSKILLATGHVYKQSEPGLMKSGLVVTISDNSLGQDFVDMAAQLSVGERPCLKRVTGDDVLQVRPPDPLAYLKRLESFGCKVKQHATTLEFMGFDLNGEITPIYPHKHIWNISHQQDEFLEPVLDAYLRLYANVPSFQSFWRRVASELEISVKSPAFYRYFMNNPDAAVKLGPVRYVEGFLGSAGGCT